MLTCSFRLRHVLIRFFVIFISAVIIACDERNVEERSYCPSIETVSFDSDIDVKCNNSYLAFNEINSNTSNWKFANPSPFCQHQGFVRQCNITRLGPKFLKVPVRSLDLGESACIYCHTNYRPVAPMITVTQSNNDVHSFYTFNLTADRLGDGESFEIIWAKRSSHIRYSLNYWFFQECVDPVVEILERTARQIVFIVDDVSIKRVEFIIRRCHSNCHSYRKCDDDEFSSRMSSNYFHTPHAIEKVSCNSDCLNGLVVNPATIKTMRDEDILLSTIKLPNRKQTIKVLILFPILGLLIVLMFITFVFLLIARVRGKFPFQVYKAKLPTQEQVI
ncbi:unnamed protein product [Adineta ricciae]|uniref:Uncharacterized protein n=1 Tax=Adineta ricciae TaxID=249248 RepID=A0A813YAX1_ADIRI|nr:unnamed protein product [Adineta ricciae]